AAALRLWAQLFISSESLKCLLWHRCHEIRYAVLQYNFANGSKVDKMLEKITLALGDNCSHRMTAVRWYREFQRETVTLEDAEKAGMLRTSVTEENATAVRKILD
ncbi:hypothetical protein NPIL_287221, partial [Nephila pilipes]